MMTTDQIIQDLIKKLIELPDLTGLNRCAGFYLMYQGIQLLQKMIEDEREKHKDEVLVLHAKIQDLEDQLKKRSKKYGSE